MVKAENTHLVVNVSAFLTLGWYERYMLWGIDYFLSIGWKHLLKKGFVLIVWKLARQTDHDNSTFFDLILGASSVSGSPMVVLFQWFQSFKHVRTNPDCHGHCLKSLESDSTVPTKEGGVRVLSAFSSKYSTYFHYLTIYECFYI